MEVGEIDPDGVHLPGIFVKHVIQSHPAVRGPDSRYLIVSVVMSESDQSEMHRLVARGARDPSRPATSPTART